MELESENLYKNNLPILGFPKHCWRQWMVKHYFCWPNVCAFHRNLGIKMPEILLTQYPGLRETRNVSTFIPTELSSTAQALDWILRVPWWSLNAEPFLSRRSERFLLVPHFPSTIQCSRFFSMFPVSMLIIPLNGCTLFLYLSAPT